MSRAGKRGGIALPVVGQTMAPAERADARLNRERILKAARKMLRKGGEISMDALADEAGVGKGTLYRRFPDRAALVLALLDEDARALQERALAGFDLAADASHVEHAVVFVDALFDFVVDHAALLCDAAAGHRIANRFEHPSHAWQRQLLAAHLRAAARAGEIPALEPEVAAEMLLAWTSPDLLRWLVAQAPAAVVKRQLVDLMRRVLRSGG
jgi:AcrR family transcriptional regulator